MRDAILKVLVNSERALSVYELCDALNINTVEETKQLNEGLRNIRKWYMIALARTRYDLYVTNGYFGY